MMISEPKTLLKNKSMIILPKKNVELNLHIIDYSEICLND
jgi:hypothetical protein